MPDQVKAFRDGLGVFVNDALRWRMRQCLTVGEIQLLLCGVKKIDVADWKRSTQYTGGFTEAYSTVLWFWKVVKTMSAQQRAEMLHFVIGSSRAPATGFAQLMGYGGNQQRFTLQPVAGQALPGRFRLPTASTCFNTLRLPTYATMEELKQKLLLAVGGARGFDENAVAE